MRKGVNTVETTFIPKILILSQDSAFMVNSLEMNIKKCGIHVTRCEPTIRDFDHNCVGMNIVLIFAGDFVTDSSGLFTYISSVCTIEKMHLCLVGYPNELSVMEKYFNQSQNVLQFPRPFEMKELISKISDLSKQDPLDQLILNGNKDEILARKGRHSILLVGDDMMFLKMAQEWLHSDYHVTVVKTGTMAVPYALKNDPELILLDYEMPLMDGPKVLEALRSDSKTAKIPVVFLTGHSDHNSVTEGLKMRPQGYMLKSIPKEDMLASIDNFFATGKWKIVTSQ